MANFIQNMISPDGLLTGAAVLYVVFAVGWLYGTWADELNYRWYVYLLCFVWPLVLIGAGLFSVYEWFYVRRMSAKDRRRYLRDKAIGDKRNRERLRR